MAESSHQCEENEQKSYEYRLDDFLINLFFETHIFRALNLREKNNNVLAHITVIRRLFNYRRCLGLQHHSHAIYDLIIFCSFIHMVFYRSYRLRNFKTCFPLSHF